MSKTAWKKIGLEFNRHGGCAYGLAKVEDSEAGLTVYTVIFSKQRADIAALTALQKKHAANFPNFTTTHRDPAGGLAPRVTCTARVANEIANLEGVAGVTRMDAKELAAEKKKPLTLNAA